MKQRIRAVALLSMALLVGASCSNPSLGVTLPEPSDTAAPIDSVSIDSLPIDTFPPIAKVEVADGPPRCSDLTIGSDTQRRCFGNESMPLVSFTDPPTRLLIIGVDTGDAVAFIDGIRVLSRSEHFVAAQLSSRMSMGDVKFAVLSETGITQCVVSEHLVMNCTGLHHNG